MYCYPKETHWNNRHRLTLDWEAKLAFFKITSILARGVILTATCLWKTRKTLIWIPLTDFVVDPLRRFMGIPWISWVSICPTWTKLDTAHRATIEFPNQNVSWWPILTFYSILHKLLIWRPFYPIPLMASYLVSTNYLFYKWTLPLDFPSKHVSVPNFIFFAIPWSSCRLPILQVYSEVEPNDVIEMMKFLECLSQERKWILTCGVYLRHL